MKILAVLNSKGGSGKSTVISNLAILLVSQKKKVLIIDLDPQKSLENWWNQRDAQTPSLVDADVQNLANIVQKSKSNGFDYILIDTPGYVSNSSLKALEFIDFVIVPCKPTATDLRAIGDNIALLEKYKKSFAFLITQAIPKSTFHLEAAIRLAKFGEVVSTPIINRVSYIKAMHKGIGAGEIDKNAKEELEAVFNFINKKINTRGNDAPKRKTQF